MVISQDDIRILNVYEPSNRATKYMKQETRYWNATEKIDKSIVTTRDFNTPLSLIGRTSRQKINKDILSTNLT